MCSSTRGTARRERQRAPAGSTDVPACYTGQKRHAARYNHPRHTASTPRARTPEVRGPKLLANFEFVPLTKAKSAVVFHSSPLHSRWHWHGLTGHLTRASMEDLTKMSRRQLQAEAKQHGVKANLASDEIIRQLLALRSESPPAEEAGRGGGKGGAAQQAQDQEECTEAFAAEEPQQVEGSAAAAASGAALEANTALAARLGRLSERLDRARLSLVSAPADEPVDVAESPAHSPDEVRRDSLEEELERQFSPPKTTVLLPATPKNKTPRASLGWASRLSLGAVSTTGLPSNTPGRISPPPTPTSAEPEAAGEASPAAVLGVAAAPGGVVTGGIYGAPQAASSVARPWTPSTAHLTAAPSSETGSRNVEAPEGSGNGVSILQTEEYWRMRAERSEKKRRRFEEGASEAGEGCTKEQESTQSFCKRIAGMCQEVTRMATPHKNLGLSASAAAPTAPRNSSFKTRPPPLASPFGASPRAPAAGVGLGASTPEAGAQASAGTPTLHEPITPSGLSKSAKVFVFEGQKAVGEGGRRMYAYANVSVSVFVCVCVCLSVCYTAHARAH